MNYYQRVSIKSQDPKNYFLKCKRDVFFAVVDKVKMPTGEASGEDASYNVASETTRLPLARVRQIAKVDPDVKVLAQEAVFVLTRATEMFIEMLAKVRKKPAPLDMWSRRLVRFAGERRLRLRAEQEGGDQGGPGYGTAVRQGGQGLPALSARGRRPGHGSCGHPRRRSRETEPTMRGGRTVTNVSSISKFFYST